MPGLDPGIHSVRTRQLKRQWKDCRVKPGNDGEDLDAYARQAITRIGVLPHGRTRRVLPEWARFALSLVFLFVIAVATAGLGTPFFLAIMLSAAVAIAVFLHRLC
jgi:hypothetical protein